MKAALLTAINQPLEIHEPEIGFLDYGQVLVKVLASGICGAQLQEIRGEKGTHFPRLMGHEGCGIVQATGPAVTRVAVGDKVVMHWRKGEGIESPFPCYRFRDQIITGGKVTTFQTEALVSENRLTPVPMDTPNELCALLGCGLSTALGTIENEAELKFGESVLIIGVGGLGANLILAARVRGAGLIVARDCHDKSALARSLGAYWDNGGEGESDWKYDVIIDTSGNPDAIAYAILQLNSGGRFIMVGQPKPGAIIEIPNGRNMFDGDGKTIRATQGGCFNPTRDIPRYLALYRTGKLDLNKLITHRLPLEKINEGLDLVRAGQAGRVLIEMT